MAGNPLDELMSSTVAVSTEEAEHRRPALPFGGVAPRAEPVAPSTAPAPAPISQERGHAWPAQPSYQAPAPMPSAMQEIWARGAGAAPYAATPPPRVGDDALRGVSSAYAFSNAAAVPYDAPPGAPAAPRWPPRERVDYLWHDATALDAITATPAIQDEPTRADEEEWLPAPGAEAAATMRAILRKRAPAPAEDLAALYEDALDRGEERLYCVVRGELQLSFEPVAALRAVLALVTPFLSDARVKDAHDAARMSLDATPNMPAAIAASHKDRIDEAMKASHRAAQTANEGAVERALLETRALARRDVFGEPMVRAFLVQTGRAGASSAGIPAYLTAEAAARLPLMSRVTMRLIVDVRPSQDATEQSPLALRVVALGRVVEVGPRSR